MTDGSRVGRRALVGGGVGLLLARRAFAAPGKLAFVAYRNGVKVGEHAVVFSGGDEDRLVSIEAALTIKLGPVPFYRYRHSARERWSNGVWRSLEAVTNGNGKVTRTIARAAGSHVRIEGRDGIVQGPAQAAPLSHWNPASFGRPLFNPQEGRMLKVRCAQVAPGHWAIRGGAEIDDFYDGSGNWIALKSKLEDGSRIEYRRA